MNQINEIESVQLFSGRYSCKADLRLNRWLLLGFAPLYILSRYLLKHHVDWSAAAKLAVTLAPLLPCILQVRSYARFIRGMDELQRRVQLEAWLGAVLGTLLVDTVFNTLNANGVEVPLFEHGLELPGAIIVMFALWLAVSVLVVRRYK